MTESKTGENLVWIVSVAVTLSCAYIFFIDDEMSRWADEPLTTTLETMAYPVQNISFPAITVCRNQHYKYTYPLRFRLITELLNQYKFACNKPLEEFDENYKCEPTLALRERFKFLLDRLKEDFKNFDLTITTQDLSGKRDWMFGDNFATMALYPDHPKGLHTLAAEIKNWTAGKDFATGSGVELHYILMDRDWALLDEYDIGSSYEAAMLCYKDSACIERHSIAMNVYFNAIQYLDYVMGLGDILAAIIPQYYKNAFHTTKLKNHHGINRNFDMMTLNRTKDIQLHQLLTKIMFDMLDFDPKGFNVSYFDIPGLLTPFQPYVIGSLPVGQTFRYSYMTEMNSRGCLDNQLHSYAQGWENYLESKPGAERPCSSNNTSSPCCSIFSEMFKANRLSTLLLMKHVTAHNDGDRYKQGDFNLTSFFKPLANASHAGIQYKSFPLVKSCYSRHKLIFHSMKYSAAETYDNGECFDFYSFPTSAGICSTYNTWPVQEFFRDSRFIRDFQKLYVSKADRATRNIGGTGPNYRWTFYVDGGTENSLDVFDMKRPTTYIMSLGGAIDVPTLFKNSFDLISGFETSIALTIHMFTSKPEIIDLPLSKRNCRFYWESQGLKIFKVYGQANCQYECMLLQALEHCHCAPYNQPVPDEYEDILPVCDFYGAYCFDMVLSNMTNKDKCGCVPDCEEVRYVKNLNTKEMHYTSYCKLRDRNINLILKYDDIGKYHKSVNFAAFFKAMLGEEFTPAPNYDAGLYCERRVRQDIAIVNIEVDSDRITKAVQNFRVTVAEKVAYMGGTIGFFTGASLLSTFSMFKFLIDKFLVMLKLRPSKKKSSRKNRKK